MVFGLKTSGGGGLLLLLSFSHYSHKKPSKSLLVASFFPFLSSFRLVIDCHHKTTMLFTASAALFRRGLTKKGPEVILSAMSSIPRRSKSMISRPEDAPVTLRDLTEALNAMETKMDTKLDTKMAKAVMTLGIGLGGLMISLFVAGVFFVAQMVSGTIMMLEGRVFIIGGQNDMIAAQDKLLSSRSKGWF